MEKYLVRVTNNNSSNQSIYKSNAHPEKIYLVEATGEIWNNGKRYGSGQVKWGINSSDKVYLSIDGIQYELSKSNHIHDDRYYQKSIIDDMYAWGTIESDGTISGDAILTEAITACASLEALLNQILADGSTAPAIDQSEAMSTMAQVEIILDQILNE